MTIGINNVLDRDPPFVYEASNSITSVYNHGVLGRYCWTRLTYSF